MTRLNEDGSAGGIFTLVSIFILAGFLLVTNGFVLDQLTSAANSGMFTNTPASQMRYDVFNLMVMIFRFQPILILLSLGINRMIESNMQASNTTPLSVLGLGIVELEFVTVIVMAVTMFGGSGIDNVVSVVSNIGLGAAGNAGVGGFALIQYIPNIFYGMMFLILVGACIQFVLSCVRVTDYSNSITY